ncbi:MAG: hybrid sensor histidine kinase/response regulator [Burkholderiaceae bacterium]
MPITSEADEATVQVTDRVAQAILDRYALHATGIPLIVFIIVGVVCGLSYQSVPLWTLIIWTIAVITIQLLRARFVPKFASDLSTNATKRLSKATVLSGINGIVLASAVGLFPFIDEVSRAIYTMIMIGMAAGAVATTTGHPRLAATFTIPLFVAMMIGWGFSPTESPWWLRLTIVLLLGLLWVILNSLGRDLYRVFKENFEVNEQLEHALQAEQAASRAKTRFLASASHDLRQPLHTLSLLSAALAMRPMDEKTKSIAGNMNEAMSNLASELDTLLDISKLDAGIVRATEKPFRLSAVMSSLATSYRLAAEKKGLDFRLDSNADLTLNTDRTILDRILRNLLDNAIKYSESGSIIVDVSERNGQCLIKVSDTGIGIELSEQSRVFEEFYQTDNPGRDRKKGLGLGLSIVRRLVEVINGKLTLDSVPGQGSTFSLLLPVSESKVETRPVVASSIASLVGKKVLLVEDDEGVLIGSKILLEGVGCLVTSAARVEDAVASAREVSPEIVLCDLRLQDGESGIDVIKRLRDLYPSLPVLLVSGETTPAALKAADELGLTFLVKPVSKDRLCAEMAVAFTGT